MAKKWTEMVEKQLLIIPHLFRLVTVQFFFRLFVSIYSLILCANAESENAQLKLPCCLHFEIEPIKDDVKF